MLSSGVLTFDSLVSFGADMGWQDLLAQKDFDSFYCEQADAIISRLP